MFRTQSNSGLPIPVTPACHAQITFDISLPRSLRLIVEHLRDDRLLARESRPLPAGQHAVNVKTHPDSTHIACALDTGKRQLDSVRFAVACNQPIEPAGRHFIVIGAMKAGTTSLFEMLAQHPALCGAYAEENGATFNKEIDYFREHYKDGDSAVHYDWRFPFDAEKHAWTLEVSPGYTKWPGSKEVPERMASLQGKTKLAYILRDPVDRIESHLAHTLQYFGEISNQKHCVRTSRYAMQLDKFMLHFDRDDVLLLDFAELQRNPTGILAQVCDFLEIGPVAIEPRIHNIRDIEFRLDPKQRAEFAEAVRPDVLRLISDYDFRPAESWLQD